MHNVFQSKERHKYGNWGDPKKEIQNLQWVDNASHVGSVTIWKEFCT